MGKSYVDCPIKHAWIKRYLSVAAVDSSAALTSGAKTTISSPSLSELNGDGGSSPAAFFGWVLPATWAELAQANLTRLIGVLTLFYPKNTPVTDQVT